jgi:hypothetical protein
MSRWPERPTTNLLDRKLEWIMASIEALQQAAQQITTDVSEAVAALGDLSAKASNGDSISQAEIDAVTATLSQASASLDAAVAQDDPAPAAGPGNVAPGPVDAPVDAPAEAPAEAPVESPVLDAPAPEAPAPAPGTPDAPATDQPVTVTEGATPGTTTGDPAPSAGEGDPGVTTTQAF